jgi:hypothetical protein
MQFRPEGRRPAQPQDNAAFKGLKVLTPKVKSVLNIVQDASAALPQNCLERIGY